MGIAETSTEYIHVPLVLTLKGEDIAPANPRLAFLASSGNPTAPDWWTAEWIDGGYARLLVGPSGGITTLTAGLYWVWITWESGLETPVYRAPGQLTVY